MTRIRRLRCALGARGSERGATLVELVVAISLTAMVVSLVVTSLVSVSRTLTTNSIASNASSSVSIAMREVTRIIRSGTTIPVKDNPPLPVFAVAGANSVTLHAYMDTTAADPRPVRVELSINAGLELVETRWDATPINVTFWGFTSTPVSERILARGMDTGAAPAFTYLDSAGDVLEIPATGVLTALQIANVAAVTVHLTVDDPSDEVAEVAMTNTVGLPNLNSNRVDGAGL